MEINDSKLNGALIGPLSSVKYTKLSIIEHSIQDPHEYQIIVKIKKPNIITHKFSLAKSWEITRHIQIKQTLDKCLKVKTYNQSNRDSYIIIVSDSITEICYLIREFGYEKLNIEFTQNPLISSCKFLLKFLTEKNSKIKTLHIENFFFSTNPHFIEEHAHQNFRINELKIKVNPEFEYAALGFITKCESIETLSFRAPTSSQHMLYELIKKDDVKLQNLKNLEIEGFFSKIKTISEKITNLTICGRLDEHFMRILYLNPQITSLKITRNNLSAFEALMITSSTRIRNLQIEILNRNFECARDYIAHSQRPQLEYIEIKVPEIRGAVYYKYSKTDLDNLKNK
jgi:hypothetical protein